MRTVGAGRAGRQGRSAQVAGAWYDVAVSAWRREALSRFPELRAQLGDDCELPSVYSLWFLLLDLVREAHREGDDDLLRRIYSYGEWCWDTSGDLLNAVAVAFYEHLFDERWMRADAARRLRPDIARGIESLLEARLDPIEVHQVIDVLRSREHRPPPPPHKGPGRSSL